MEKVEKLRSEILKNLEKAKFHSSLAMPGLRYASPDYLEFWTTYDSGSPLVPCKIVNRKIFFMGQELKDENALGLGLLSVFMDPRRLLKYLGNKVTLGERKGNALLVGRVSAQELIHKIIDDFNLELTEEQINEFIEMNEPGEGDFNCEILFEINEKNQLVAMQIINSSFFSTVCSERIEFWYEK